MSSSKQFITIRRVPARADIPRAAADKSKPLILLFRAGDGVGARRKTRICSTDCRAALAAPSAAVCRTKSTKWKNGIFLFASSNKSANNLANTAADAKTRCGRGGSELAISIPSALRLRCLRRRERDRRRTNRRDYLNVCCVSPARAPLASLCPPCPRVPHERIERNS